MVRNGSRHCTNLRADRDCGDYWERQFCKMAAACGRSFTGHQWCRSKAASAYSLEDNKPQQFTLPDVTLWTYPAEHHEIKHKEPTGNGKFGLEVYRFDALKWLWEESGQGVYYTIHRHDLAGGRDVRDNRLEHWVTAPIERLVQFVDWGIADHAYCPSWVGGVKKNDVPMLYWTCDIFKPLAELWGVEGIDNLQFDYFGHVPIH